MRIDNWFLGIIILGVLLLRSSFVYCQSSQYPVRVAVLDSAAPGVFSDEQAVHVRAFQLACAEVFSQELRKIPDLIVLPRELFREKFPQDISQVKIEQLLPYGINTLFQIQLRFVEKEEGKVDLILQSFSSRTGRVTDIRKLRGPEEKVLEMIDDFVFSVASFLNRNLSQERIHWINKRNTVSMKAWYRYGRGLDFYYLYTQRGAILAREQFKKAEAHDILFQPTFLAEVKNSLFLYESNRKNVHHLNDAYENLRKVLFTDSKYLEGYEGLAYVYFLKGNYVDSIREGLRALRLNPLSIEARFNLARSYMALAKKEQAQEQLNKLLEIDPTNLEARKLLAQ